MIRRRLRSALVLAVLAMPAAAPAPGGAQRRPDLRIRAQDAEWSVPVETARGFAAVPVTALARVGWNVVGDSLGAVLVGPQDARLTLRDGTPYFGWGTRTLQLTDAPYFDRGTLAVPLQLLTDFLPQRLPDLFTFDGPAMLLGYAGPAGKAPTGPEPVAPPRRETPAPAAAAPPPAERTEQPVTRAERPAPEPTPVAPPRRGEVQGPRVVIIDAGHGGHDPGSISRSGLEEKTVALGVALALAHDLDTIPGLEVHLLRDDDTFIPVWDRGQIATGLKGERPGLFVSVHANSFNSSARGFETYFLSDARTEHERRVAAIENAPIAAEDDGVKPGGDLDFILRDMKNLDTQHWSALLAELVQDELAPVHPGPNRGVKQAPLAVITNALMPAVLVEIGYLSHPDEARLMGRKSFQEDAGRAIARAVTRFFERYPPGSAGLSGAGR